MDMQNVKNLEIPEGSVKTIHDKDNRLIWGAVGYDTKYAGNTYQQTYSGKNLCDGSSPTTSASATSSLIGNTITISSTTTVTAPYCSWEIPVSEGDIVKVEGIIKESNGRIVRQTYDDSSWGGYVAANYIDGTSVSSLSVTAGSGITKIRINLYSSIGIPSGDISASYENVIITKNNSDMTYEPYCGGIPSPSPDYPQNIDVVTGEQTITISDGVNSEDFEVHLGTIELAKIGTYQDYIYKSGDDWYIRKAVAKSIFTGSASESWQYVGEDHPRFTLNVNDIALGGGAGSTPVIMSNYFIGTDVSTMYGGLNNSIASHNSVHQIWIRDNSITSDTDFKTWLSTHNTTVYYALVTPTDAQITDSTLISQLNAIHQWLTRYGYSFTVSGNLPLVINQTNLT